MEDNMNLLKNKPLLRNLLNQGDSLNTMNGGVSMTEAKAYKTDYAYEIVLSAPTVSPESFNIFLNYNQLIVYALLKTGNQDQQAMIPMFSKSFDLPVDADLEKIEALHEEGMIKIIVPFKDNTDHLKRKIDIKTL